MDEDIPIPSPPGRMFLDAAERFMVANEAPPAAASWLASLPAPPRRAKEPGFHSYKLKRYRDLYEQVADQILEDGFFPFETNGDPIGFWLERFDGGVAVFGYLSFECGGMSRLPVTSLTSQHLAINIEHALLNCRVQPRREQPAIRG
jgi:hypothetical protein